MKQFQLHLILPRLLLVAGVLLFAASASAWQGMATPKLHVEGRFLKDSNGKNVLLHGYMQPTATWFNGQGRWYSDPSDWTNPANVAGMLNYLRNAATLMSHTNALYGRNHGWYCNFVRVNTDTIGGWTAAGGLVNPAQFNGWIQNFVVPYAEHLKSRGMYLVLSATGPINTPNNGSRNAGVVEQQRLITFWQTVANAPGVKSADNIHFELMNEPVEIESVPGNGQWGFGSAQYFLAFRNWIQPVIDVIRATGADNVIWVPTLEWQGSPHQHALYPFTGSNCGVAVHYYPAYGGVFNNATAVQNLWNSQYKPAADLWPMIITEMFWTPFPDDPWNLVNGTTAGFGNAIRNAIDNQGNVSYLVGFLGDLLDDLNDALPANCALSTREGAQAYFDWLSAYIGAAPGGGPSDLIASANSATEILLTWNGLLGATNYTVKRSTSGGGPYTTIATGVTGTNYTDTVAAGIRFYYLVSATIDGEETPNSIEATVNPPHPWQSQDIGAVGVAGSVSFNNGMFSVRGSGTDIWDTSDRFRFVYLPVNGDCTVTVRVLSLQNTDPWAKAGVMIRASLNTNSAHALVAVTPANGVAMQFRSTAGGNSSNNNTTGLAAPYWVRLVRSGNTFTAFRSPDGVTWTQQGSATTINMATTAYVGLAVTAHNNAVLAAATYDNVTVPGWENWMLPPAPAELTVSAGSERATLTWVATSSTSGYNIKRATTPGGPYGVVTNVSTTSYTDTGLVNGTNYYYVISALNPAGESPNSTPVSMTPEPVRPQGLLATAIASDQINLAWIALSNATSYNVKRSLSSGGPYVTIASEVTATNYSDEGLAGGTLYYYVVSAMLADAESDDSVPVSAATQSPILGSLVHRYSFSETGGSTIADSVGGPVWSGTLPNNGTLSGGQLVLAPGAQYASLPAGIVSSLSNITVMAWVNLASATYWSRIFDFGNDTSSYMFLMPQNGFDYTMRFAISTSGPLGEQKINSTVAVNPGGWHQVAVTLNSGMGILYLDGVAVGTNGNLTLNPSSLGSTTRNYIGKSQSASDPYLTGALDEFRIYNVALTPAEIAATAAVGPDELLSWDSPPLSLAASGANVTLTWPVAHAGFTVQARTNLVLGDWQTVPAPAPQIVGDHWQVSLPQPGGAGSVFYRLVK